MIKIIVSTPASADGTSFYRVYGTFKQLSKIVKFQTTEFPQAYQWPFLKGADILFLHRPFRDEMLPVVAYAKELGVKIWIDHDDNLFQLPPENPSFDAYNDGVRNTMFKILKLADIVTVSTNELKKVFDKMGLLEVEVVPNAVDDTFPHSKPTGTFNKAKNFFWRGTPTHVGDLLDFAQAVNIGILNTPDKWYFMGYNPFFITEMADKSKWEYIKAMDIIQYFKAIKYYKPHLMHVPLSNNPFNHCKSNIAWIEATVAGGACLAPDWEEWRRPGLINYKTPQEYLDILLNPPDLEKNWKESLDYINENLVLSKVNQQRKYIIEKILDKTYYPAFGKFGTVN